MPAFLDTLGVLFLESAPALVIGYTFAGLLPVFLSPKRLAMLSKGGRGSQAMRGVAFGLPLPVCSCGVLPLYESIVRRGAAPAAALAFFVATPELGLDAVLLSFPLLGGSLTMARIVAAVFVAVVVAYVVRPKARPAKAAPDEKVDERPLRARLISGLRFGYKEVFDHTMPWIVLGLVIAALVEPLLDHGAIATIPPWLQVPVAALVGVPVYVCASGATPLVALAMHKGLSAGAAVAFLIAGPATNVTTFGVLARLHGARIAAIFGISVSVLAILMGWTVDVVGLEGAAVLEHHPHASEHATPVSIVAAVAVGMLLLSSLFRQGPRGLVRQITEPIHSH
ncbi:MAG: permease [Myxococcota bacterium]